jgi:ribose-phosphate pyrophosphokinase
MFLKNSIIFSTESYINLKELICENNNFEKGILERKTFPDGEKYTRIISDVLDRNVIFLGGTINDSDTLDLYDISCAISKYGAKSLTIVIPYYSYSTMERAVKKGEVVTAKTRARLFSSIPQAYKGNRIVLLDLHAEGIPHYFEGSVHTFHLYAKPVIIEAIKELSNNQEFILASTDAGRAKWVESLANDLNVKPAFVYKKRINGEETQVSGISADVENKVVIIYDDMIRTGSSLINAAKAYLECGAKEVYAVTTHGIFPNDSLNKIKNSGYLKKIICTDSYPRVLELANDFLVVKSISSLITEFLLNKNNF